jgi:prepilin-type N-terminal cleavage/methylation domain-containing protein
MISHHLGSQRRSVRRGLSLLEVMLALAILGGAVAAMGQLVRIGARSAAVARDSTTAQLWAESKMAEVSSGITLPENVFQQPIDDTGEWLCSVESQTVDQQGLLAIYVTVEQDPQMIARPVMFTLTRWIIDPQVEEQARLDAQAMKESMKSAGADANQGQAGTTQSAGSQLGGAGGGGGMGGGGPGGGGNNNGGNNDGGGRPDRPNPNPNPNDPSDPDRPNRPMGPR